MERDHFQFTHISSTNKREKRKKVILSQYRCERQKVRNMKNSEMGTDVTVSTTWFVHEVLVFAGQTPNATRRNIARSVELVRKNKHEYLHIFRSIYNLLRM
jgi:hypothetical protein